jgi:Fuc2NAc and GlcNAc transferase
MILLAAVAAAAIISWLVCAVVKANAVKWQLVDVPNTRSSHVLPTPRGGGLGIVVAFCAALLLLVATRQVDAASAHVLIPALLIALLGFVDDRKSLGIRLRLSVQLVCAVLIVLLATPDIPVVMPLLRWLWLAALVLYAAWLINLYNFMDGIDGIAAIQAITVLAGAIVVSCRQQQGIGNSSWLVLMAACGGFLLWNWSPAKLFMGDVGSTFLGAVLAIWSIDTQSVPLASWLILMAAFIGDASCTLLARAWRREAVWQAHRSHLYQRLAHRWGSHARVCWALVLFNLLWLAPMAVLAAHAGVPVLQYGVVVVAYLPIVVIVYTMS